MKTQNRVFAKKIVIVTLAFAAAAAGLEWDGYRIFDRDGHDNPLCRIDPSCRAMTSGEIAVARGLYGDTIDYGRVKIFHRKYMGFFGDGSWLSPNGSIYIADPADRAADYSDRPEDLGSLIHELAHVWQEQTGQDVRRSAAEVFVQSGLRYQTVYDYRLDSGAPFSTYNLEQQATILEDYFDLRMRVKSTVPFIPPVIPGDSEAHRLCDRMAAYESRISQQIPVSSPAECVALDPGPEIPLRPDAAAAADTKKIDFPGPIPVYP